jgi:hypothetical protein
MLTLEREHSSASAISSAFSARRRDEDQRIDLADRAVDAPAAAHFAKVADELAVERGEVFLERHGCIVASCS